MNPTPRDPSRISEAIGDGDLWLSLVGPDRALVVRWNARSGTRGLSASCPRKMPGRSAGQGTRDRPGKRLVNTSAVQVRTCRSAARADLLVIDETDGWRKMELTPRIKPSRRVHVETVIMLGVFVNDTEKASSDSPS
jgi:hypothetical protein